MPDARQSPQQGPSPRTAPLDAPHPHHRKQRSSRISSLAGAAKAQKRMQHTRPAATRGQHTGREKVDWRMVRGRVTERLRHEKSLARGTPLMRAIGRHRKRLRLGLPPVVHPLGNDGTGGCLGIKCRSTLDGLYDALVDSLEDRAVLALDMLWIPIVTLHQQKRRQKTLIEQRMPERMAQARVGSCCDVLQKSVVFRDWAVDVLRQLCECGIPRCAETGDTILHEGEPAGKAMVIMMHGEACVRQHSASSKKRKGFGEGGRLLGLVKAPALFGEFSLLCDEPRLASLQASTACDLVWLRQGDFLDNLWRVPPPVRAHVTDASLLKRKENLVNAFQVTEEVLRRTQLFSEFPASSVQTVLSRLQPLVSPPGSIICEQGDKASEMWFVARGSIRVKVRTPQGQEINVATLTGGACFGEWGLLFGERRTATACAIEVCELWVLSGSDLSAATSTPGVKEQVRQSVNRQRLQSMHKMRKGFSNTLQGYILKIPLLRRVLEKHMVQDLAALFQPCVYSAGDIICTKSEVVNRVIVLTRGKAQVHDGGPRRQHLAVGETIGFTCLLEHRWLHPVVAVSNVDIWAIDRDAYIRFLRQHGLWRDVLRMSALLMQPYIDERYLPPLRAHAVRGADTEAVQKVGGDGGASPSASPKTVDAPSSKDAKPTVRAQAQRTVAVRHFAGHLKMMLLVTAHMKAFIQVLKDRRAAFFRERQRRRQRWRRRSVVLSPRLIQQIGHLRPTADREVRSVPPDFIGQVRKMGRTASMLDLKNPDLHPRRTDNAKVFPTAGAADNAQKERAAEGEAVKMFAANTTGAVRRAAARAAAGKGLRAMAYRRAVWKRRIERVQRFLVNARAGLCRTPAMTSDAFMRLQREEEMRFFNQHAATRTALRRIHRIRDVPVSLRCMMRGEEPKSESLGPAKARDRVLSLVAAAFPHTPLSPLSKDKDSSKHWLAFDFSERRDTAAESIPVRRIQSKPESVSAVSTPPTRSPPPIASVSTSPAASPPVGMNINVHVAAAPTPPMTPFRESRRKDSASPTLSRVSAATGFDRVGSLRRRAKTATTQASRTPAPPVQAVPTAEIDKWVARQRALGLKAAAVLRIRELASPAPVSRPVRVAVPVHFADDDGSTPEPRAHASTPAARVIPPTPPPAPPRPASACATAVPLCRQFHAATLDLRAGQAVFLRTPSRADAEGKQDTGGGRPFVHRSALPNDAGTLRLGNSPVMDRSQWQRTWEKLDSAVLSAAQPRQAAINMHQPHHRRPRGRDAHPTDDPDDYEGHTWAVSACGTFRLPSNKSRRRLRGFVL
eukprot:TRINITY_DN25543_c0_g1_i2.p1 TRINITY_DN25543_c0_g1~~TRINITY_DN25543_c0_g1_i2.p1  ORF type:complete len:1297 (+),score=390.72 TRINITY_DN25543_c0_g1_i2:55-3945(+)